MKKYVNENGAYGVLLALFFACALYAVWSMQFSSGGAGVIGGAGSDSFIIVDRISRADSWPWYFQSYLSQIGGQGIALAWLFKVMGGESVPHFALMSSAFFALLTALSVSIAVPFLYRHTGIIGVLLVFVVFASSRWMYAFSHSLYWVLFTLIIPLTFSMAFGRMLDADARSRKIFLVLLASIIFIKSVCGYEYITTVTLLACAGYVLSTLDSRKGVKPVSLIWVFVACLAGFAAAFLIHLAQLYVIHGWDGVHHIFNRILMHSGGDGAAGRSDILVGRLHQLGGMQVQIDQLTNDLKNHQVLFFWLSFIQYFSLDALNLLSIKFKFSTFSVLGALAAARVGFIWYKFRHDQERYPADFAWALATVMALLAALSWQVLAWKHMTIHYHLNGLIFFVGLVPLSTLWLYVFAKQLAGVSWKGPDVRYVSIGLAIVVPGVLLMAQKLSDVRSEAGKLVYLSGDAGGRIVRGSLDKFDLQLVPRGKTGVEIPRGLRLPSTRIQAGGWAFSTAGAVLIELKVNGVLVNSVAPDVARADVAKVFPGANARSGFTIGALVPAEISPASVEVWIVDEYGNRLKIAKRE